MKNAFRNVALALGVIAGAALIAAPASAGSIQRDGYFGGTWKPFGPPHNRYVQRFHRRHGTGAYAYYAPSGYYGPGYDGYGPRGGVSLGLSF